jgi:predicted NBD/HSP70 family sugar kinase
MASAKPSLDLLRTLTDEHVLRALMENERLTRAEIAAHTGISKPTISDAVRRLVAAELLVDTGERSTGRGRSGSYFTLSPGCGAALVVSIGPEGVVAEAVDAFGAVVARSSVELDRRAGTDQAAHALAEAAGTVRDAIAGPLRTVAVSAADPVDRRTGRLVHLPDAPFLVGDLDPRDALHGLVDGPVVVDNDVNWAARAERAARTAPDPDNLVYLHLGEGLGCAVVCDGVVWRGHSGLAGEIAHVVTAGPDGRATRLIEVFGMLGLRRPDSTAIDVDLLRSRTTGNDGAATLRALAVAASGALMAAVALADPGAIVVGGSWGREDAFLSALRDEFARSPRRVPVVGSGLASEPELVGARTAGLEQLRDAIVGAASGRR